MEVARNVDLLIFDSLIQFHTRNEDKASEMKVIMGLFKQIAKECNVAIILLHQRRKPGQFETSEIYTARGSLQIIYDSDMAFTIRKVKQEGRIFEATKSRIVKEPAPFRFEIQQVGEQRVNLVYLGEYQEAESKKERARNQVPIILQDTESPLTVQEIQLKLREKGINVSEATLRPILRDLEKNKTITSQTEKRGRKFYYYPHEKEVKNDIEEEMEEFLVETASL